MYVPVQGFAPDRDPFEPGTLTDCSSIVPTIRGLKAAASGTDLGIDAVASTVFGIAQLRKLDDNKRLFAGAATKLYELSTTTWTDRTRAVGGAYSASLVNKWRFAQFGNVSLAVNKGDTLQESTTGAFADISGAPTGAAIVETVGQFVFLFDTNDATYGDSPDRWWCSALGDYTDWTPAISTQCATGRLTSIPGPIRAGRRLGERIVAYKARGISVGTYTGPAFVWSWADIPGDIGAVSQETVIDLGTAHLFMSQDGFFSFDGVNVTAIDIDVRNWWLGRVDQSNIIHSRALHNRLEGTVTWYYPISGTELTEGVVYNYRARRWGRADETIDAVVEYVDPGLTWDNLGNSYTTWDQLPNAQWDLAFPSPGGDTPAIVKTDEKIYALNAPPGSWSMTTGDVGHEQNFLFLERVIPRWLTMPQGANFTNYYRNATSDAQTQGQTTSLSSGRFDVYRSARWHSGVMAGSGAMELAGFELLGKQDGTE